MQANFLVGGGKVGEWKTRRIQWLEFVSTKSQIAQQKVKPKGLGLDAIVPSLLSAMETIFAFLLVGAHM